MVTFLVAGRIVGVAVGLIVGPWVFDKLGVYVAYRAGLHVVRTR